MGGHQPRPRLPRQRRDLEPAYLETGAIHAMNTAAFRQCGSRFCAPWQPVAIEAMPKSAPNDLAPAAVRTRLGLLQDYDLSNGANDKHLSGRKVAAVASCVLREVVMALLSASAQARNDLHLLRFPIGPVPQAAVGDPADRPADPHREAQLERCPQLASAMADTDVLILALDGQRP